MIWHRGTNLPLVVICVDSASVLEKQPRGTDQAMSLHTDSRKVVEKRSKAAEGEAPQERARLRRGFEASLGISNLQTNQTFEAPLRPSNGLKNSG
jgi:hypothetical protein